MYEILFTPHASREYKKLTLALQEHLTVAIDRLGDNPRQTGVRKLTGMLYRLRVGDWRIIYAVLDKQRRVVVVKIARRSEDTYQDLDDLF